ncbi:MAG: hypothetical protein D6791_07340 [Chloroflexi bacterium]|nr:MAG: hypothetical protein D6791_07340 [Chloroflexota bacterium]
MKQRPCYIISASPRSSALRLSIPLRPFAALTFLFLLMVPLMAAPAPTHAGPDRPANLPQRVPPVPDGLTLQRGPLGLPALTDDAPRYVFLKMHGAPLARLYADRKKAGAGLMSAASQRSYVQRLAMAQRQVVAGAEALGVPVISTYQKVLNGVQVKARPSQFDALLALPGVESIHPVALMWPVLDDSVPHIGAQRVIDELGIDGTGVDIGIIDTGIDYIHADFGGPGTEEAYQANDNTRIDDTYQGETLFPTDKVVGGWDFVGELYDADCSEQDEQAHRCTSRPQPDPDPVDDGLHGTHVAGIAAGTGTGAVPHGVAPGARLWALKVFGAQGSTSVTADAIEWAVDPNNDGDISDALDVINMSLGAPFSGGAAGAEREASVMAIQNAVAAGIVVVASAGNSGDAPLITGSPASIPQVISVASSYAPGETRSALEVTAPESIAGLYEVATAGFGPSLEEAGPIQGEVVYAEPADGCQELTNAAEVGQKIALIDRGTCTFVTKVRHAQAAGAVAVIVVNNVAGPPIGMADDGTGSDIAIPAVMISQSDGDVIKGALPGVNVTLSAGVVVSRPDLTDNISSFSSRGPGWERPTADLVGPSPILFKPEITAPGSNILSSRARSGTEGIVASGTSMSSPHVAGVAALLRQAHPDWTPAQVKAAIMNTARPEIYVDGHPAFGGGGTVAPATRMGAGLVDAFAAINTDVFAFASEDTPAVDFGFLAVSEPTTLTRTVTIQNDSDAAVTYNVAFTFQDADDADAGVDIRLSDDVVTVPAGGSATVEVTADVDPQALKDWPLSGRATGSGDALRDIEYSGWLTFTPVQDADVLSLPVYLLARKSADIAAQTTSLELHEFGAASGASVELTNASSVPGTAEVFTLAGLDPNEENSNDAIDVRAVGVRNTFVEGLGNLLEFAFTTHAPRMHPVQMEADIFIDVNQDRTADYILFNADLGTLTTGRASGVNVTVLSDLTAGTLSLEFFTETDLFTTNIVLPVIAEDLGLGDSNLTFDYWIAVFDALNETLVDVVPEGAFETPARFTFDGAHPLYVVDNPSIDVVDRRAIGFFADPVGALAQPSADGLLILYDSSPTNVAADAIEIDFAYQVKELAIEADRAATGFVNSRDVTGSSLGGSRMWTGVTIDKTRWYGVTQFDLASEVPSNAHIVDAALDLTGQEAKYLDPDADATWMVELLDESVDSAWPDVKFYMVHRAGVDTTLGPALTDEDLSAGTVNVFQFDRDQMAILEQRVATTGRVSFRTNMVLDRLSQLVDRHLFAWDGGGGIRIPGEHPPVLRIKYVAAR